MDSWWEYGNIKKINLLVAGTQTAGLGFGGTIPGAAQVGTNATQHYDGSAWTAGGNMGTARYRLSGTGTQTAGLAFGGYDGSNELTATEHYDGSAWTAGGNLATSRYSLSGTGTQTAGLAFGGYDNPSTTNATEEYTGPGITTQTITAS
jgi:hypothetical protein